MQPTPTIRHHLQPPSLRWLAIGWLWAALLPSASQAATQAALLTLVAGEVTLQSDEKGQPARPFSRLYQGDRLTLADGARIKLVYFDSYQQESWSGQTTLTVGLDQSEAAEGAAVERKSLPAPLIQQLERSAAVDRVQSVGMVRLRAIGGGPDLSTIDHNYQALRDEPGVDAWSAHLYRLSALAEISAWQALAQRLDEIEQQLGSDPFTPTVVQHFRDQIAAAQ